MKKNNFSIELLETHWISRKDTKNDLCAHEQVKVIIGDEVIVKNDDNGGWTVSAAALMLLRTLECNHIKDNPVGDQLIPCCGHFLAFNEEKDEVYVGSCPTGINWDVIHEKGKIILKTENGSKKTVDFEHYKNQVLAFVDMVKKFYCESPTKEIPDDEFDRKGYLQFWKEWHQKRNKYKVDKSVT